MGLERWLGPFCSVGCSPGVGPGPVGRRWPAWALALGPKAGGGRPGRWLTATGGGCSKRAIPSDSAVTCPSSGLRSEGEVMDGALLQAYVPEGGHKGVLSSGLRAGESTPTAMPIVTGCFLQAYVPEKARPQPCLFTW
eukprot:5388169-Amphidinium_carterae.1